MVAIIDYDAGNTKSVQKAVSFLGFESEITWNPGMIVRADHVILPGVGAFGAAMERLKFMGLDEVIREVDRRSKPLLGICLGEQLFFEESEESPGIKGLGIFKGRVKKLPEDKGLKVPNIGWNSLDIKRRGRLFEGIDDGSFVYFVHSYYVDAADKDIVSAAIDYGVRADVAVERGNTFAFQFHPEKSSETGLTILKNFLKV